jgi:hypothetical protein
MKYEKKVTYLKFGPWSGKSKNVRYVGFSEISYFHFEEYYFPSMNSGSHAIGDGYRKVKSNTKKMWIGLDQHNDLYLELFRSYHMGRRTDEIIVSTEVLDSLGGIKSFESFKFIGCHIINLRKNLDSDPDSGRTIDSFQIEFEQYQKRTNWVGTWQAN